MKFLRKTSNELTKDFASEPSSKLALLRVPIAGNIMYIDNSNIKVADSNRETDWYIG